MNKKMENIMASKRGFYCETCDRNYQFKSVVPKKEDGELFFWLTCPKCGDILSGGNEIEHTPKKKVKVEAEVELEVKE